LQFAAAPGEGCNARGQTSRPPPISQGDAGAPSHDGPGAFTLLEVLLALSIMSVLAVALFASLHAAFKAKRSAEESLEAVRTGEATIELLRGELEFALPPRGVLAGAFTGRDWVGPGGGADDDVTFYSNAAPPPTTTHNTADVKKVMLTLLTLEGTGERVLARRVTSNLLATVRPEPDDEILCRGVFGLDLKYFDGTFWWNSWDSTLERDALPVAVEVTLELDPPKSRTNAGDDRPLRFSRVIQIPCTGEGDESEREPLSGGGEAGPATNGRRERQRVRRRHRRALDAQRLQHGEPAMSIRRNLLHRRGLRRRGTVLVMAIWVILILAALVMVYTRSMRVELVASGNRLASEQAAAVELGAEQYVMARIDGAEGDAVHVTEAPAEGVPVGGGYFWIIRP
jgi:general secretion pathway protein J